MIRRKSLRKPSYRKITKPLILVGIRSSLDDIIELASVCGYHVVGILDHYYYGNTKSFSNIPIIGDEQWLADSNNLLAQQWIKNCWFICTTWWTGKQHLNNPGLNLEKIRQERIELLDSCNLKLANLIHPKAKISSLHSIKMGNGVIIMGEALIGRNVVIGNHSVIDWQANLAMRVKIGKGCIIGVRSNITNYEIGNYVRIGVAANCIGHANFDLAPNLIGNNSVVHVGATVFDDIPSNYIRTFTNKTLPRIDHADS